MFAVLASRRRGPAGQGNAAHRHAKLDMLLRGAAIYIYFFFLVALVANKAIINTIPSDTGDIDIRFRTISQTLTEVARPQTLANASLIVCLFTHLS